MSEYVPDVAIWYLFVFICGLFNDGAAVAQAV
jgi:hypothetical protein